MSPRKTIAPSVPGAEDILRRELANGITVLVRENFDSSSIVINGYLDNGSLLDPDPKLGLAYLTAGGLMRGTRRSTMHRIYDRLETAAASLGFGASVHTTSFGGRALAEDLPIVLETLQECLTEPRFPILPLEKLRMQMLTGLMMRDQDTEEMAGLAFDDLLFHGHPYSRPEEGHIETLKRIRREDVISFHQNNYSPLGMKIAIVGAVEKTRAVAMIEERFGEWKAAKPRNKVILPEIREPGKMIRKHVAIAGKVQTNIIMGGLGPCRGSEDYMPASLGNNILGQFGMMGRIGLAVRERAGLAYSASTSLNAWSKTGTWEMSAGVNPANVEKAIALIQKEIKRFIREAVSKKELEDSQANYIGRMPLSLESNAGVAGAIINMERFSLGLDYLQRYPQMVKKVSVEDILHVAKKYLHPSRMVIVSAGPEMMTA